MAQDTGERTPSGETPVGEEQKLHAAIVDACPAVIYVKDTQGRYLLVNRQWETLFQLTRDQVKGKIDFEIFAKENAESFRERDREALEAGAAAVREEILTLGGGKRVFMSLRFPIAASPGLPRAVCGIWTEITEGKRADEALRQSELTDRQREVLQLLAEGHPSKEIAAILHVTIKTVEFHKSMIRRKLHLRGTAELIKYAIEHRIAGA